MIFAIFNVLLAPAFCIYRKTVFDILKKQFSKEIHAEQKKAKETSSYIRIGRPLYASLYLASIDTETYECLDGKNYFSYALFHNCGTDSAVTIMAIYNNSDFKNINSFSLLCNPDFSPYFLEAFGIAFPQFTGHNNRRSGGKPKFPEEITHEIIRLREEERLSFDKISSRLNIPPSTVKYRYKRACIDNMAISELSGDRFVYESQIKRKNSS